MSSGSVSLDLRAGCPAIRGNLVTAANCRLKILDDQAIEPGRPDDGRWQLVVVYRGLHCPICKAYLSQIETVKNEFDGINVDIIAISTDPEEKARQFRDDNDLSFAVGYGLSIRDARALGLFISDPLSSAETDQPFAEPGTYLIRPDGTLQIMDVANAPFQGRTWGC